MLRLLLCSSAETRLRSHWANETSSPAGWALRDRRGGCALRGCHRGVRHARDHPGFDASRGRTAHRASRPSSRRVRPLADGRSGRRRRAHRGHGTWCSARGGCVRDGSLAGTARYGRIHSLPDWCPPRFRRPLFVGLRQAGWPGGALRRDRHGSLFRGRRGEVGWAGEGTEAAQGRDRDKSREECSRRRRVDTLEARETGHIGCTARFHSARPRIRSSRTTAAAATGVEIRVLSSPSWIFRSLDPDDYY
ncbi:hypothetical protein ABIB54_001103 [Frigoribacterium sp. UYMn621]|jgi:hypothetical protein